LIGLVFWVVPGQWRRWSRLTYTSDGCETPALKLLDMASTTPSLVHLEQLKQALAQRLPVNSTVYVEGSPAMRPEVVTVTVKTYQVKTATITGVVLPFEAMNWERRTQQQITEDVDALVQAELLKGLPCKGPDGFTRRALL
jgi:hypothetical protein